MEYATRASKRKIKNEPSSSNAELLTISTDTEDDDCLPKIKKQKSNASDSDFKLSENEDKSQPQKASKKIKREQTKTSKNKTKTKPLKSETKTTAVKAETVCKIENFNSYEPEQQVKKTGKLSLNGWKYHDLLAEKENLDSHIARNIINLFQEGNTLPFIARYRKNLTNDITPEQLRNCKETFEEICHLESRVATVCKSIEKLGKMTPNLKNCILNCRNLTELEHIYAPFKQGSKKTLAERAKTLGLENPALALLTGSADVNPRSFVNASGSEGIRTLEEVEKSFMHIIAHSITTDTEVLQFIRTLRQQINMKIETKKSPSVNKKDIDPENIVKFERYFDFQLPVKYIKPHQILAINRGELLKVLSIKVVIPDDYAFNKIKYFCEHKWLDGTKKSAVRIRLFQESCKDAYKRLISPLMIRQTRAELKTIAEKASLEVFTTNLKNLLLSTPVKGQVIMGIDPGFNVGCKIAVVSSFGELLDTGVIHPHTQKSAFKTDSELIKSLLHKHNCSLIAIGNGKACRETETWLTNLIQSNFFNPLDVSYTIVDESGASVYSCSEEAKKEFPNLDVLVISAASLARRVQDPLAELVKIDPKSLGVGMYQHDLNKKTLDSALNEVVTECVSFVGVDLNTASHCLLRKVAGMNAQRADSVLQHRASKGPFTNRYQLKDVKGIGEKVFIQCAGFLRVGPQTANHAKEFYERPDTMPLDCTWIHPESYDLARNIIHKFKLSYKEIGQPQFIKMFQVSMTQYSIANLSTEFNESESTIKLIVDVLCRPLDHDLRVENEQLPLFKKGITSIYDIKKNMTLTGRVTNVTHFGAFVDIGVGRSGLIHNSAMNGINVQLGDRIEVKVLNIEIEKQRIGLEALNKI